jgi:dihydroorotase-like cyclic amidohydrolase
VFDYGQTFEVKTSDQFSKCGWTPYDGETLRGVIKTVYIAGKEVKLPR